MQRIGVVGNAWMAWPHIGAINDGEAALFYPVQQFGARTQAKMLGDIRENQPTFATGLQVPRQSGDEAAQHPAIRIEDRALDR